MGRSIQPYRKRIRLPADAYAVPGSSWFVTIGVANRTPVFANAEISDAISATLADRCAALGVILDLYCLMPDHAHLLIQIGSTGLIDVIGDLKSHSTRVWWQHGGAGGLWQRSFHDRGIRDTNDYQRTIDYILANPVNAGLVADWREFPWLGGGVIQDLSKI